MNAGMLNQRITIQALSTAFDNIGNEITEWLDYKTVWAYANGLSGNEYFTAATVQAENTVVFTIRFANWVNSLSPQNNRLVFNGKIFDIKHIDNVRFENETIKIKAIEKVGLNEQ